MRCASLATLSISDVSGARRQIRAIVFSRRTSACTTTTTFPALSKLVFELYTSGFTRDEAHYLMSTTKSVTSALVGAALDRGLLPGTDTALTDLLPAALFGAPTNRARFRDISLKDVMGMSALDAEVPPFADSPVAVSRGKQFSAAPNRVVFALTQALLPTPGVSYQYNDITPVLAGGAVQYATGKRLFDFATETLFAPMGFKNAEWMHQDGRGLDLPSYGLRLRPIDMQKFGILYLNHGVWNGRRLLSEHWVDTSWTPYMHTGPSVTPGYDNYGWFWWQRDDWGTRVHWTSGWRGQFIAAMPDYDAVFTMTAYIQTGDEGAALGSLMTEYVIPALAHGDASEDPGLADVLTRKLAAVNADQRMPANPEPRMVPSVALKEKPRPFDPEVP
jgi:CubicO group peptidase (beta-lactamase class C family)